MHPFVFIIAAEQRRGGGGEVQKIKRFSEFWFLKNLNSWKFLATRFRHAGFNLEVNKTPIIVSVVLGLLASLSHVVPLVVSRNLSGDFSAHTFMMLQSLAEIMRRSFLATVATAGLVGIVKTFLFHQLHLKSDYFWLRNRL